MRALCVALALWPLTAAAQPEMRGPLAVDLWDAGAVDAAGTPIPVRVYYSPDSHAPEPVVAVVHGWLRNGGYMREMASDLASRGFVAVVPDMPCGALGCDHAANAAQISALLDWAVAQGGAETPLRGRVDGERRGVIGHSWGGLAVFLAGTRDPRLRSAVCLDPNDDNGVAAAAAAQMRVPSAYVFAENKGACNSAWMPGTYGDTAAPHLRVMVRRSGHCDVEDPTDGLCPIACGGGDPATTPYFRRYAVAWTACLLKGDAEMAPWLGGAALDADVAADAIGDVDQAGLDALPCRAMTDASVPVPDAAPLDATPVDAAPVDAAPPDAARPDASLRADAAAPDAAPDATVVDAAREAPDATAGHASSGGSDGCAQVPPGTAVWPLFALLGLRRRVWRGH